jgi:hypothetical protein
LYQIVLGVVIYYIDVGVVGEYADTKYQHSQKAKHFLHDVHFIYY